MFNKGYFASVGMSGIHAGVIIEKRNKNKFVAVYEYSVNGDGHSLKL